MAQRVFGPYEKMVIHRPTGDPVYLVRWGYCHNCRKPWETTTHRPYNGLSDGTWKYVGRPDTHDNWAGCPKLDCHGRRTQAVWGILRFYYLLNAPASEYYKAYPVNRLDGRAQRKVRR